MSGAAGTSRNLVTGGGRTLAGFSLKNRGLRERACAPMPVVDGWLDPQPTCEDVLLLLQHGDAKEAWVNPEGRHMSRSPERPGSRIQSGALMPWMLPRLRTSADQLHEPKEGRSR